MSVWYCLCCWKVLPSYYSLVSYEKHTGSINPISVGKWMLHLCLASFLAEAVMTAGGKFISSWFWVSQPSEEHEVGSLDSRRCFRAISWPDFSSTAFFKKEVIYVTVWVIKLSFRSFLNLTDFLPKEFYLEKCLFWSPSFSIFPDLSCDVTLFTTDCEWYSFMPELNTEGDLTLCVERKNLMLIIYLKNQSAALWGSHHELLFKLHRWAFKSFFLK